MHKIELTKERWAGTLPLSDSQICDPVGFVTKYTSAFCAFCAFLWLNPLLNPLDGRVAKLLHRCFRVGRIKNCRAGDDDLGSG